MSPVRRKVAIPDEHQRSAEGIALPCHRETIWRKDVALVQGLAAIGQQIKNIVSMSEKEIPFSSIIGANIINYISKNRSNDIFLNESVNSSLAFALKNIFNISSTFTSSSTTPDILTVNIKFDYQTRTNYYKDNRVSVNFNTTQ